ncbi:endonuclease/exonuclease/phosphatase family protein [Microseira sp. BLCC-F43]|jgi:endonuclease/exonuclease/phosphatase (EEP) superfamily protein YafD|uniref:endonuclease/exonuclease/phosphatase family protein n=1 Tax=Microseira sp. BLCC-F43 TaxID=3153602 RepID=UPI0035B721F6
MQLKQIGKQLGSIQFLVNILAAGAALATALSFVGSWWWIFAMLEHFRPQYCLLLTIALFLDLINRDPWSNQHFYLLWAIPLAINFSLLLPLFLPSFGHATNSIELRVLHATLDNDNPDVSKAIDYVNNQAPDIVSLLEVTPQSLPQLQAGLTNYQLVIAEPRTTSHGSAWFVSRQPSYPIEVKAAELIHLPPTSSRPILQITITYAGKPIDLLCFHAIRPRSASTVDFQRVEFEALAQWSRQRQAIVVGDFNSTPWYGSFRQMLHQSGLVNSQNGFGLQPTWHGSLLPILRIPIDHCLHSPSIVTIRRTIGSHIGSDHLPLLVTLRI